MPQPVVVRPNDWDRFGDDYQFDRHEFNRWDNLYGPFTLDGAASPQNYQVSDFCSKEQSFLERDVTGHTVWLNPPFGKIAGFIKHFEDCRKTDPYSTQGLLVVPDLQSLDKQAVALIKPVLMKYKLLHTYPKGSFLFSTQGAEKAVQLGPTPWAVDIYLADHTVERREQENLSCSTMHASQDSYIKKVYNRHGTKLHHEDEVLTNRGWKDKFGKEFKPNQHSFTTIQTAQITSQQAEHDLFVLPGLLLVPSVVIASQNKAKPEVLLVSKAKHEVPSNKDANQSTASQPEVLLVSKAPLEDPSKKDANQSTAQPDSLSMSKDNVSHKVNMLVDCGASESFISKALINELQIPTKKLKSAMRVALADGSTTRSTHSATISFQIGPRASDIQSQQFIVTDLSENNQCILGMPWFKEYNPDITWADNYIRMKSGAIIHGVTSKRSINLNIIHASAFAKILRKNPEMQFHIAYIKQIDDAHKDVALFGVQGYDENRATEDQLASIETQLGEKYDVKVREMLKDYSLTAQLDNLPPSRGDLDHAIPLIQDATVPPPRIYKMSPAELEELTKQLKNYLEKGWIRPSNSQFCSPVLFARKPGSTQLRLCIDFRGLNKITKRSGYPLPLIDNILDTLKGATCFTKLDLANGFHQIRIKEEDIHKTSFGCQYGQYEWVVMPFGMSASPGSFQRNMNSIFKEHLGEFISVYLDDILVFSKNPDAHMDHVQTALQILRDNEFHIRFEKCKFGMTEVEYLGHVVNSKGVSPSPAKVQAVLDWPIPTTVTDVRQFLGFVNYYRKHIPKYSQVCKPLYDLTKNESNIEWSVKCQSAFDTLRYAITHAPVLMLPKTGNDAEFVVCTDASQYAAGAVLLQKDESQALRPIAYYAKTFNKQQMAYPTYDQEFLAIICALQEWKHYLEGCKRIDVLTDHVTLQYLTSQHASRTAIQARRYVGWLEILAPFVNYLHISYKKGDQNMADALSRRPDLYNKYNDYENTFEDEAEAFTKFLGTIATEVQTSLMQDIRVAYRNDPALSGAKLPAGVKYNPKDGMYRMVDKIYVPSDKHLKETILQECHNTLGHGDLLKTMSNIRRTFFWPNMAKSVKAHLRNCKECMLTKNKTTMPMGENQPLPIPKRPWEMFSVDFIVGLPDADGYNCIATFVDLFTKQAHFVPCHSTISAQQFAKLYIDNIYKLHGLSKVMVGDRDSKYTSEYFRRLFQQLGTKLNLSTAFHPQTDGQTERVHRTIEQILRAFVYKQHDQWLRFLPLAEFSYNNNTHASTGYSPFYSMYGFNPYTAASLIEPAVPMDIHKHLNDVHDFITDALIIAKAKQSHYADQRQSTPIEFAVNDKVMVNSRNIAIRGQPSRKLKQKFMGPYKVIEIIAPQVYKLELPKGLRVHNVFHVSKLQPWTSVTADIDVADNMPAQEEHINGEDVYTVDRILDCGIGRHPDYKQGKCLLFKVRWLGFDASDDTWEPYNSVKRLDAYEDFLKTKAWRTILQSPAYQELQQRSPQRVPSLTLLGTKIGM
jgi:hypothetical protein